jgi:hypothetical protein
MVSLELTADLSKGQ